MDLLAPLRRAWTLLGVHTATDWLAAMTRERIPVPKRWNT